eukprot:s1956_g2.t1
MKFGNFRLQVTNLPLTGSIALGLEICGRRPWATEASCVQGLVRFQDRFRFQIQGHGSEGQSCVLRVCQAEETIAEVALSTKDIMRRVHSKHGQQYFHYRMFPKDGRHCGGLHCRFECVRWKLPCLRLCDDEKGLRWTLAGSPATSQYAMVPTVPTFCLLSGETVDIDSASVADGSVALARQQLAVALQLPLERLELVVDEQVVLKDSDHLQGATGTADRQIVQVCIRPDPLQEQLPALLGCEKWSELELLKDESGLELLPDVFGEKLPRLKTLRLSQNQLRLLPRSFGELRKLQALQAEGNRLSHLPDFTSLSSLTDLQLEENQLEALPETFGQLAALQRLSLDFNLLRSLPESFGRLRSLQKLRLVKNLLESLPQSFGSLSSLKDLWLTGNRLQDLPESFGGLSKLQQLRLGGNQLLRLPESFGQLKALRQLALEENLLQTLPCSFSQLSCLQVLNLDSNRFAEFPESLGLKCLEKLWIGNNALRSLPQIGLSQMEALKELSVKSNKLQSLPESLGLLSSLEVLYLQDNALDVLPKTLAELRKLRMLWLEDNQLSSFPSTCLQLSSCPALQLVKLRRAVLYHAAHRILVELKQPLLRRRDRGRYIRLMSGAAGAVVGTRRHHQSQKEIRGSVSQGNLDHSINLADAPIVKVYHQSEPSTWKELRVPRAFRAGVDDSTRACTLEALQRWLSKQLQDQVNDIGVVIEQTDEEDPHIIWLQAKDIEEGGPPFRNELRIVVCFEGEEPNSEVVKELKPSRLTSRTPTLVSTSKTRVGSEGSTASTKSRYCVVQ